MPEYAPRHVHREGFVHDNTAILKDLYRLITIFLSANALYKLANAEDGNRPFNEVSQFESAEIARLLISSAAIISTLDDLEHTPSAAESDSCGQLETNTEDTHPPITLTLREASNKIIHASKIRYGHEEGFEPRTGPEIRIEHRLYLYGQNHGRKWRAVLELEDFVREAVYFVQQS